MPGQLELIDNFLRLKRIAVVGVSRNKADLTRSIWREFRNRGIDAAPVHPGQTSVEDVPCFPRVQDVPAPVEGALLMVSKERREQALRDCVEAGIRFVWIYGVRGEKDLDPILLSYCEKNGITAITGYCPFMFLPEVSFFHRFHAFGWKLIGYYPK